MSFDATRTLLATALDTVTGVTGHTFRPAVVKNGSAWPSSPTMNRGPGDAWLSTWEVTVVLGQDERTAAMFLDAVWDELVQELEESDVCYVNGPGTVLAQPIGGTQMQVLQLFVTAD